jgi:hypothetical protein
MSDKITKAEQKAYNLIIAERERQRESHKHDANHHPATWILLIAKQLGQASDQLVSEGFDIIQLEKQIVQIAALSVAYIEILEKLRDLHNE